MEMKWNTILRMHRIMRMPSHRKPGMDDLLDLSAHFKKELQGLERPLLCDRDTFVRIMLQQYVTADFKHVNRLYSALDVDRTDAVDFRDFIAVMRVLRAPTESVIKKISKLFSLYDVEAKALLPKPVVKQILYTCAVSREQYQELDNLLKPHRARVLREDGSSTFVERGSFLGLSYITASGTAAAMGDPGYSLSTSTAASEQVTLAQLLDALDAMPEVLECFKRFLIGRLQHAGFEGRPEEPRSPVKRIDLPEEPNVTEERFKEVMGHNGSSEAKLVHVSSPSSSVNY